MGGSGLSQKHKYGDQEDLHTGQGKSLICGKSYERQENSQSISLAGGMEPGVKVRQSQETQGGRGKEEEPGQNKQYAYNVFD
jgi:hypothetical protein